MHLELQYSQVDFCWNPLDPLEPLPSQFTKMMNNCDCIIVKIERKRILKTYIDACTLNYHWRSLFFWQISRIQFRHPFSDNLSKWNRQIRRRWGDKFYAICDSRCIGPFGRFYPLGGATNLCKVGNVYKVLLTSQYSSINIFVSHECDQPDCGQIFADKYNFKRHWATVYCIGSFPEGKLRQRGRRRRREDQ